MEYAWLSQEYVNAIMNSKEKLVKIRNARKTVLGMDCATKDYAFVMKVSWDLIVLLKIVLINALEKAFVMRDYATAGLDLKEKIAQNLIKLKII